MYASSFSQALVLNSEEILGFLLCRAGSYWSTRDGGTARYCWREGKEIYRILYDNVPSQTNSLLLDFLHISFSLRGRMARQVTRVQLVFQEG